MTSCAFCPFQSSVAFTICPVCGCPMTTTPPVPDEEETPDPSLSDVSLDPIDLIVTGSALDVIGIDGERVGVPAGAVVLLWGLEGSGKSRVALCAADGWCETTQGKAYYTLVESMSVSQLRRMAHEHEVKHLSSIIPTHPDTLTEDVFRHASGPTFYVIDSSAELDTVLYAKNHVTEYPEDTVLILMQATKDGEFLGKRALAHEADVVVQLEWDEESLHRMFRITKNRFGLCGVQPCRWPPQRP